MQPPCRFYWMKVGQLSTFEKTIKENMRHFSRIKFEHFAEKRMWEREREKERERERERDRDILITSKLLVK